MQLIFLKEQIGSAIYYKPNGPSGPDKLIPFHEVGDDIGGIKLESDRAEDQPVIERLQECITTRTGGVWLSNDAEYNSKKKQPIWRPSNPVSEPLKVFRPNRLQSVSDRPEDVAAVAEPVRPPPSLNPRLAQDLTKPGKPAIPALPPAESGQEPPPAVPVNLKPRVGKATIKPKAPDAQVTT
jgi:hypothetical protein